jgi:hypothetical protein
MSRRPVVHEGKRIRNLWARETVRGEPRFDVQVRVDGKPTFRVLKARTLDDALVELEGFRGRSAVEGHAHERGSTVRAMGEPIEVIEVVDIDVHDGLVAIVREAVRAELQAWASPAAVIDDEDVPPDPLEQFDELEHYSLDEPSEPPWAVPEPAWDERQAAPGASPLSRPAAPEAQPPEIDRKEWARLFKERMEQKR